MESESSPGRADESLVFTRGRLRTLIPQVFAQPASDDVVDALIEVLVAYGILRSEAKGFGITTNVGGPAGDNANRSNVLLSAIESAMLSRPALAVLAPVLAGRAAWCSSPGTGDDPQARAELQDLEQAHDESVRRFGSRLEVAARLLVGYVIDVRRSRLGEKIHRLDLQEAQAAAERRARSETESAMRVGRVRAEVHNLLWRCTYNVAPDELGVLKDGPTNWETISDLDWVGYASRWMAERIVPALLALRGAAPILGIDFEHALDYVSTAHDVGMRRRQDFMRREMLRLGAGLDDTAERDRAAEVVGRALKLEAGAYRHFHDYFEGLAATIDRHVRRSRTAAHPAVPTADLKAIDPARMEVRLLDTKRAECAVDGVIVSRLSAKDLTPRQWQLFIGFFQPEPDQAATARLDQRSPTRTAGDLDEPADESTDATDDDQHSPLHVSKSTVPGMTHLRDAEERKGVASQSANRRASNQKAMRRLNLKLVALLGLTRDPFPAVRGQAHQNLFKSTILRAGVE